MGGTAAMNLAGRNPGLMRYVASYSGLLTTTTLGMPQAITFANKDAGGFDAGAMWGPPGSPEWDAHDPYQLAEELKGVSMYVSSGSGLAGLTSSRQIIERRRATPGTCISRSVRKAENARRSVATTLSR